MHLLRRLLLLPLAGLLALPARAQAVPAAPGTPTAAVSASDARPFFSRLSGLFSNDLPELDRPNAIELTLRPHFGDLIHRDYMRTEAGLRWALSDNFELRSDASVFFTHGLKGSAGYGIGKLHGSAKYIFTDWPWTDYETSVELNFYAPVGHPPLDMSDGFYHLAPTFVAQHTLSRYPRLTLFAGAGLDLIKKSTIPGTPGFNQPRDNSASVTTGGVYDAGQVKWTLSTTFATTSLIGERSHQFYYLQPGLLWYVPRKYTFHSKTQFIVGLGARATWGPDGSDVSLSSRLRVEITFREVMEKMRLRKSSAK